MAAFDTERLLADARLVIDYAARTGKLPDSSLSEAVDSVEASLEANERPNLTPLISALNKAVAAIPLTIVDLRDGRSPFDQRSQKTNQRLKLVVCVATLVVACLIALVTEHVHRQDAALKAFHEIIDARYADKLNAVRRMAQWEDPFKPPSPNGQYHTALRELKDLYDRISSNRDFVFDTAYASPFFSWRSFADSAPSLPTAHGNSAPEPPPMMAGVAAMAVTSLAPGNGAPGPLAPDDPCELSRTLDDADALPPAYAKYPLWLLKVIKDSVDVFCFANKLNLNDGSISDTSRLYRPAADLQQRIAFENGWILPFLAGVLGSLIFLLRNILDTRTPNLEFLPALLRIALGGIAGIVIGWLTVPTTGALSTQVSSVPFGLAFVTGFSIDILFSLLDRVNRAVTDPDQHPGNARPADAR